MTGFIFPASPYRRWTGSILAALVVAGVAGASLTTVEITSQASGRVVPLANVRPVDSQISGKVLRVFVTEGQQLAAGDRILELDSVDASSEKKILDDRIDRLSSSERTYNSLISTLRMFDPAEPGFLVGPQSFFAAYGDDGDDSQHSNRQVELIVLAAKTTDLDKQGEVIKAAIGALEATIERSRLNLAIEADKASITERLFKSGAISKQEQLTRTQPLVLAKSDLNVAQQEREAKQAELTALQFRRKALIAETEQKWQALLQTATSGLAEAKARLAVVSRNLELSLIRAPAAGRLEELKVKSEDARVNEGETIAKLVPTTGPMLVEARLPAQEAGFIVEGQTARLKLDAYPAERYGTVRAKVLSVSADTVQDETTGTWSYLLRLEPEHNTLSTPGGLVSLTPGMTVKVDIITGSRRLISYLFEPISRSLMDGLRER